MKVCNQRVKESQETRVSKGSLVVCINRGIVEMKWDFFSGTHSETFVRRTIYVYNKVDQNFAGGRTV